MQVGMKLAMVLCLLGTFLDNARVASNAWWRWLPPTWLETRLQDCMAGHDWPSCKGGHHCIIVGLLDLEPGAELREDSLQNWGIEADFLHQ